METNRWKHPGELLAVSGGYWESCAIHAAVGLGIFDAIEAGCTTAEEVAIHIGADTERLEHLLKAVVAMELLVKEGNRYGNTEISRDRLCRESENTLVDIILHHKNLVGAWAGLAECISPQATATSEDELANFLLGMRNMGNMNAPAVLERIDLTGRSKLLDLGSGPGAYSLQFCTAYPALEAVLFDRPTTRPFVESLIAERGMSDRMRFKEGDFTTDPIGDGYDLVWASHVLHSNPAPAVQELLSRIFGALEPGGRLIVQEFILNSNCDGPVFPALFSLNMMVNGNGGKSYSISELTQMMEAAGFVDVHLVELPGTSDLVVGDKRGHA